MAAVGDIYQITVTQQVSALETFNNVFYYGAAAGTPSADDLNSAFVDDIWDVVRTIQAPAVLTTSYYCINGNDNTDWELSVANDAGVGGGVPLPLFVAAGFRTPFLGTGKGYGYKRIGGIPTGFVGTAAGGAWNTASQAALEAVQDVLGLTVEGDNAAYDPVIITGGFTLGVAPTVKGSGKGDWQTNAYPSSQVTRKVYSWQRFST